MNWIALPLVVAVLATGGAASAVVFGQHVTDSDTGGSTTAADWRARGLDFGYNLDRPEAIAAFRRAVAADAGDPASYRLLAGTAWTALLFDQGAITIDDFLGEARARYKRPVPRADLARTFHDALDRALALSEQQLHERPNDAAAHYQVGAAHGFRAAYAATVEGQLMGSLGPARRAYKEHQRVLELDPSRKDAGLIVGMYRYAVAAMPFHLRLGAYLAGFGGGRERGLRLVEDAAAYPSEIRPNAQFILVLLYNRESRFDDALRVIRDLRRQFPRNRLLWLEEGGTALRAGRPAEARAALEEGLSRLARDTRPRAPGEEARWRFAHGAMPPPPLAPCTPHWSSPTGTGFAAAPTRSSANSRILRAGAPTR
jgi:tetratricopeptide (TPR) repeat protein